jgi:hypothetical protein
VPTASTATSLTPTASPRSDTGLLLAGLGTAVDAGVVEELAEALDTFCREGVAALVGLGLGQVGVDDGLEEVREDTEPQARRRAASRPPSASDVPWYVS